MKGTNQWHTHTAVWDYVDFPSWAIGYYFHGEEDNLSREDVEAVEDWRKGINRAIADSLLGSMVLEPMLEDGHYFSQNPAFGKPTTCFRAKVSKVFRWRVDTYGEDHAQYFPYVPHERGGTIVWGQGYNDAEAYADAVEGISSLVDWVNLFPTRVKGITKKNSLSREVRKNKEWYRFVSVQII